MKVFLRSPLLWQALAAWSVFWLVAPLFDRDTVYNAVTAITTAVGIGVLVAYAPGIVFAIRAADRRSGNLLILGIGCTWTAVIGNRVWGWAYQFLGRPEWMNLHYFLSFLIWIVFTGGVLHLTAFNAIDGKVPPRVWAMVGGIAASGILVSYILAWLVGSTV